MPIQVAFNRVDTAIYDLDQNDDPWTVHFEVRVPGRLDPVRVRDAAAAAADKHPLARARMESVRPGSRRLEWLVEATAPEIPLEVVTADTASREAQARDEFLSRRVDLTSAPTFALLLIKRGDGDTLVLSLSHVAGDGMSANRLMTSIARAYAGHADPTAAHDLLQARKVSEHVGSRSLREARRRASQLGSLVSRTVQDGPPGRVAVDGGKSGRGGYGFQLLERSTRSCRHSCCPSGAGPPPSTTYFSQLSPSPSDASTTNAGSNRGASLR